MRFPEIISLKIFVVYLYKLYKMKKNKRVNCWEYKKCGREPGGSHVGDSGICPAATTERLNGLHGGINGGRACWYVVGTLCDGAIQGTYAKKYRSCIYCDFYKKVKEEYFRVPIYQKVFS